MTDDAGCLLAFLVLLLFLPPKVWKIVKVREDFILLPRLSRLTTKKSTIQFAMEVFTGSELCKIRAYALIFCR